MVEEISREEAPDPNNLPSDTVLAMCAVSKLSIPIFEKCSITIFDIFASKSELASVTREGPFP